jgi:formate-dependent nitrite reductase membrane component NrfD
MSESNQASSMTWLWPLILSMPLPSMLNMYGYAENNYLSVDLIIAGIGMLASGLLLRFVVLPKATSADDPDRTSAWHRALAGPFIWLGALIAGLGAALLVVPGDSRSVNITWASFCLLMVIDLGVIMVRAVRVFSNKN